jgi:hypothetical protein
MVRANHTSRLPFSTFNQVSTALQAFFRIPRVAGSAERAVDIRTYPRLAFFFFFADDLLAVCLFKFNFLRLRCPTLIAEFIWSGIDPPTVRAGPLQFNLPQILTRHR